jgi:hypothetical protein
VTSILLTQTVSFAQTTPPLNEVYIDKVGYAGPGCRQGTAQYDVSIDAQAITVTFSDFIAEAGPQVPAGKDATECTVTLDIEVPQGWSYTIFDATFRGFAALEEGVTGTLTSRYFFQANKRDAVEFQKSFSGLLVDSYQKQDSIGFHSLVWSDCRKTRSLNINARMQVDNTATPDKSGMLTVDSLDGQFTQVYGLQWRRCN